MPVTSFVPFNHERLKNARPRLLLMALFLFAITHIINILTWILCVSKMKGELEQEGITAYLVFAAAGFLVFLLVSGPLLYWPYAHGSEMSPRARRNAFCLGIVISFFAHDLPVGWMEIWIVWSLGWNYIMQAVSLFLTMFCLAIGFFTTWIAYTWELSKVLQIRYGDAAPNLPPASAAAVARVSTQKI